MRLTLALAAFLTVVFCSQVSAKTISLDDLVDSDNYFDSGDKRFDLFAYSATGDMPLADAINITDYIDVDGNYGIEIQGGFVDLFGNGASDALISFRVTALDPDMMISDAHLSGNTYAIGDAVMQVVETFLPNEDNKALSIYTVSPNPGNTTRRVDGVVFENLYRSLLVQKDILALAQSEGSAASMSVLYQSFSQEIYIVPEPSSIVFLLSSLALLGCCVRRFGR